MNDVHFNFFMVNKRVPSMTIFRNLHTQEYDDFVKSSYRATVLRADLDQPYN